MKVTFLSHSIKSEQKSAPISEHGSVSEHIRAHVVWSLWFAQRLNSAPCCQALFSVPKCKVPWDAACPNSSSLIQPMMQPPHTLKSNVCKVNLLWPAPTVWYISLYHTCWWNHCVWAWCECPWSVNVFSQWSFVYSSTGRRILSRVRWSVLQSEYPQLSANIEVTSYYHLSWLHQE